MAATTMAEEVVCQGVRRPWPFPNPLDCAQPDLQGSPDLSPNGKGPIVDDMVVAAVISLQDPVGSGPDDICTWIEAHYPAVERNKVKAVMSHMVQAGRLQPVLNQPSLVRMGGAVRQLEDKRAIPGALLGDDDRNIDEEQEAGVVDDTIVAEHALLAAHAVAEAEEASKKASSLLDAANELEDLDHHGLSASAAVSDST